jgi:preprotein translocase subunit SecA
MDREDILERLIEHIDTVYKEKEELIGEEEFRNVERAVMLRTLDANWVEHLTSMENLRQGIGLHAYGQRDPLVMFKHEGFKMFENLLAKIQRDGARTIFRVELRPEARTASRSAPVAASRATVMAAANTGDRQSRAPTSPGGHKVGRNDPCPCSSGKKYKKCHGA